MTLQYNFNHRLHPATNQYINTIHLEAPHQALFELALLNTPEATQNFIDKVEAATSPTRFGFEQILIEAGPTDSAVEYQTDDNKTTRQTFPTADLLALLRDWLQFLTDHKA